MESRSKTPGPGAHCHLSQASRPERRTGVVCWIKTNIFKNKHCSEEMGSGFSNLPGFRKAYNGFQAEPG